MPHGEYLLNFKYSDKIFTQKERSMILLTNFTREHVNKEIGDHYRERFFRRVQWITIEH